MEKSLNEHFAKVRPSQFSIKQLLVITTLIAAALAFPEFAFFSPVLISICLVILVIISICWLVAVFVRGRSNPLAQAAEHNVLAILIVIASLLIYSAYGWYFVDFAMG